MLTVSICIANYRQDHFLQEAIDSCNSQTYKNEVVVYNDTEGVGSGEAFNRAIEKATGDIIILLCSDDVFTDNMVVYDITRIFIDKPYVGHVSRYYHQFEDGNRAPVRAWRNNDPIELANNPSGLAFRRRVFERGCRLTNKMFVEAPALVRCCLDKGWEYKIMKWDTVAVRIHNSTARSKDYYAKRWVSSPVEEWGKVGGQALLKDYTSFIQIKNYYTTMGVWKEISNFVKYRPINLLMPGFWFFALIALLTPRSILWHVPHWYRITFGRWFTREVNRDLYKV